jgi:hypothetical protein
MGIVFLLLPLLLLEGCSFMVNSNNAKFQMLSDGSQKGLGDAIKYNGKGFVTELQTILNEAINDAAIYYNGNYSLQASFISKKMK